MTTHIHRSALLPYTAQALFDMVNDVASYPRFLPWCSASEVLSASETEMRASMTVAKAGLSQRFLTRNALVKGERIEMHLEEGPFRHLHGIWTFTPLNDKAAKISLDLTFDYAGPLVKLTLGPLFNHAANTLVDAFCERPRQLYG